MVKVMYIESIELSNYRNYSNVKVEFGKNTNILYGDNAQARQIYLNPYTWQRLRSHTEKIRRIKIS